MKKYLIGILGIAVAVALFVETGTATQIVTPTLSLGQYSTGSPSGGTLYLDVVTVDTTQGKTVLTASGTTLGAVIGRGFDTTERQNSAEIRFVADAAFGGSATDTPGRIVMLTAPDGSSTMTEGLRVTDGQDVGVGGVDPEDRLHVLDGSAETTFHVESNSTTAGQGAVVKLNHDESGATQSGDTLGTVQAWGFDTAVVQGGEITFEAAADWGDSATDSPTNIVFNVAPNASQTMAEAFKIHSDGALTAAILGAATSDRSTMCVAIGGGLITEDIAGNNCDSSSARFKHDITYMNDMRGIDLLNTFKPVSFVKNSSNIDLIQWGFIAEDMAESSPNLAMWTIGNTTVKAGTEGAIPYSISKYGIMAVMTKAIQEQQVLIEDLQRQIHNLEPVQLVRN